MAGRFVTLVNLLKANVGTGILALPAAFKDAGLFGGTLGLIVVGIITMHCMHLLVNAAEQMGRKSNKQRLNYEEVAQEVLRFGPKALRPYVHWGKLIVSFFLVVTQFGFCTIYMLFTAENLSAFFKEIHWKDWSVQTYLALMFPFMTIICFINKLEHLAILSTIAILIQVGGLLIVFYNLCIDLPSISQRKWLADYHQLPLFFGTAISSLEGIAIILPLRSSMENPKTMRGTFGILNIGTGTIVLAYISMGFLGYLKYGEATHEAVTTMLQESTMNTSVKFMYAFAIFCSYPLQFHIGFCLVWTWIREKYFDGKNNAISEFYQCVFKTLLVAATVLVAAVVPELELIISLLGALFSCFLAIILPPLMDILVISERRSDFKWWTINLVKDVAIIIIGVVTFFTGTYSSVMAIVVKLYNITQETTLTNGTSMTNLQNVQETIKQSSFLTMNAWLHFAYLFTSFFLCTMDHKKIIDKGLQISFCGQGPQPQS